MVDLHTDYLGMRLKNPLVASASPLSKNLSTVQELESAGVAAVVMYSLFEEQIVQDSLRLDNDLSRGTYSYAEALEYLPDYGMYTIGPESYLDHLSRVKGAVSIPVIGSLNGISPGGWLDYAQKIEQAGADALELNLYDLATDVSLRSSELEDRHIHLVREVRQKVSIPLAIKLSPFYTALPQFASRLAESGADSLVLFNRFYQPDFDLEALEVVPNLVLSNSHEMRLPLRWIAILYGRVRTSFALTSGVHNGLDALKAIMAGASVAMLASELLKNGIRRIPEILAEIETWMVDHDYASIEQMKGSMSQRAIAKPATFERANYMKELTSY